MKRILISTLVAFILTCCNSYAKTGDFWHVNTSGVPTKSPVTIELCLDARGPVTCQRYTVSALTLFLSTVSNHDYPFAGIKSNSSNYILTTNSGCHPLMNGFCEFSSGPGVSTITLIDNTGVTYTVGGTITQPSPAGLVLENNGVTLNIPTNSTSFSFPDNNYGVAYNVTVQTNPVGYACTVTEGAGVVMGNVNNVSIDCALNQFTVGGSVTGLVVNGLEVSNNSGSPYSIQCGASSYTFPSPVNGGDSYNVTVTTNPPGYTCSVANGSGTNVQANVTDVNITCVGNPTLTSIAFSSGGSVITFDGSNLSELGYNNTSTSLFVGGCNCANPTAITPAALTNGMTLTVSDSEITAANNTYNPQAEGFNCIALFANGNFAPPVTNCVAFTGTPPV